MLRPLSGMSIQSFNQSVKRALYSLSYCDLVCMGRTDWSRVYTRGVLRPFIATGHNTRTDFTPTVFRHIHWPWPLNMEPHIHAQHFTNVKS